MDVSMTRVGRLRASGASDRGYVRPTNEDRFAIDTDRRLFVLADGMGGHRAGEVAAQIAVDTVIEVVSSSGRRREWPYGYVAADGPLVNLLRTAVQLANRQVFDASAASPSCAGMGTTLVAAMIRDGVATIAHVGDSRAYAVGGGRAEPLTVDDSWVAAMLARDPSIDGEQLKRHPMRHALTSVVGSRARVPVHVTERQLREGDLIVLTTDGVHGVLDEAELVRTCESGGSVEQIAAGLVQAAMDLGSRDNCTAVVARCD